MPRSDHDSSLYLSFGDLEDIQEAALPEIDRHDLPIVDLGSSEPFELPEDPAFATELPANDVSSTMPIGVKNGQIWLNGGVLMCACPDCGAPMSIRFWLMIADCWKCGTSIELSEEQEREARRLMAEHERAAQPRQPAASFSARRNAPAQRASGSPNGKATKPDTPQPRKKKKPADLASQRSERTAPQQRSREDPHTPPASPPRALRGHGANHHARRSAAENRVRARLEKTAQARGVTAWVRDMFGCTPAWLISLVFHIILLTLLALFTIGSKDDGRFITLSTVVSKDVREGGDQIVIDPLDEVVFDLPVPQDVDLTDSNQREAVIRADQDARELRIDPDAVDPNLPDLSQVKRLVGTSTGGGQALAARDPRIRVEVVRREGGTTLTEAAVARGLRWMAMHQNSNGSWSLHNFNRSRGCTCTGTGIQCDAAGTSLALLPYLGAGQTHLVGRYRETVSRGLRWMLETQREDGDLRASSRGNAGMYAHGQAAIVLCEAYLMTGDEELRAPAQKALDFIVEAQHPAGGWRYRPGEAGDTSVVGWQVMALQSGRAAKLEVPETTLELAGHYLDSVQHRDGALYSYQPGNGPTHVMTAEALLCRMYLGWKLDMPALQRGIEHLADNHLPDAAAPNIYYWYYGTQAFHHHGGPEWERWNRRMREILIETQERRGHMAGSWTARGPHAAAGGRLYMTALATCSLEVYYRHLPIFRQIDLE
jgi:hypothetical protein